MQTTFSNPVVLSVSRLLDDMQPFRRWLRRVLGYVLFSMSAASLASAQAPPALQAHASSQQPALDREDEEEQMEVDELEQEVGDRDPTFLRTRVVVRYDHRALEDPSVSSDRLRFRFLYAFGPKQRFAISALEPLVQTETRLTTARGSGDAEVQFNANIVNGERFRSGIAVQTTLQTSSDALLGGATTSLKPSVDFAAVLSSRTELVGALYYKRSIHTSRGVAFNQLEPDVIMNVRLLGATWFLEWDSYCDFDPDRFAQTLKPGLSRALRSRWVASAYYAVGVNADARQSQYRYNAGIDVTWYPRRHR